MIDFFRDLKITTSSLMSHDVVCLSEMHLAGAFEWKSPRWKNNFSYGNSEYNIHM